MKSSYYKVITESTKEVRHRIKSATGKLSYYALASFACIGLITSLAPPKAYAVTTNIAPAARISFTFDDGLASASTQAAPTLAKYGLAGTSYVTTRCIGMVTAPNTCRANTDALYMSWAQVTALQTAGWEIGSHTVTHPYLATRDATDGQPNFLTPAQVQTELTQSRADLAARGVTATAFSTPYGDYNNATLAQISKYYSSHRGFADQNTNNWPYNDSLVNNFPVQAGVTVAQVQAKIDQAITNKSWLVLTLHDIKVSPSNNPDDYEYSTANLDLIAAYVKTKQNAGLLASVNMSKGLVTSDTNLLTNSSFNTTLAASGWTTDNATAVTVNTANNGSYPDPTNSIRFVAGATNAHLFSPKVTVDPSTTYMLKNFVNVAARTSGEFAFFIDEYDASGNWISGQYKAAERSVFVETLNFTYKPSSLNVSKSSLQVIATGGSGITAYFDNPQWFPLTAVTQQPTNLVTNGTFDAGLTGGWTTDNAVGIKADALNNGSPANPVNSISLATATTNKHLFSPKVPVITGRTYSLSSYLNVKAITVAPGKEVGYFIDEYDVNGIWVSGQYKTGIRAISAGNVGFNYTPSSANVRSASMQVIVTGNSGIQAFVDDVKWFLN